MKRKKLLGTLLLLALAGAGTRAYFVYADKPQPPTVDTNAVTVSDIVERVQATGTLQPVRTVDVGTQISGIVQTMYADYNSIVTKGQLLAQLDPSVMQANLESAKAALAQAQVNRQQHEAVLKTDEDNLARSEALLADHVATEQERDNLRVTVETDKAQITQDDAAISVAKAGVTRAQVNVSYCTIRSPINGVVIARNVDAGQAVAARMSAPTLYELGTDLTHLELMTDVDEADISHVRPGQPAEFGVDTYAGVVFHGTVKEVRLNATTTNNVVTYQVVIDVPNPDLRLKPSMTANVQIQVARAAHVLTVSNTAVRFRPTHEISCGVRPARPAGDPAGAGDRPCPHDP